MRLKAQFVALFWLMAAKLTNEKLKCVMKIIKKPK